MIDLNNATISVINKAMIRLSVNLTKTSSFVMIKRGNKIIKN